jgi:hypothetical protein
MLLRLCKFKEKGLFWKLLCLLIFSEPSQPLPMHLKKIKKGEVVDLFWLFMGVF